MFVDFVINGEGRGPVGEALQNVRFDPRLLRPFVDERGVKCVMMATGKTKFHPKTKKPYLEERKITVNEAMGLGFRPEVYNALSMTRDSWIQIDRAVLRATRKRLRAWTDLASSSRVSFNAMAKSTYEYQVMADFGEAVVDMNAVAEGRQDRPQVELDSIPLSITHSDFGFSEREIAISRNGGVPLDTTSAEMAGFRVAEMIEKTTIGLEAGISYGTQSAGTGLHRKTSKVYGYTNYPYRVTKTDLTTPTGTNPEAVMTDILEMVEVMQTNGYYGPYMLYHSTPYSRFFNDDYFRTGSTSAVRTVRERLMEIEGLSDIRRLDYLTSGYQLIMAQMDPQVAQAIDGMGIVTVQWPSKGGLYTNYKVMTIKVPLLKAPANQVAGILHATTS